ncbi:hypothetical protein F0562_013323 [Nyssa sinensis]|uniref:Uncharacterized protein n=1 Tax=Nyssa sinensis TaxID=561372 RepID=A0A5J4ZPL1_9ASTE|nr:hypothetical protein F0562_013323 [Nyssa sinensis]
MNERKVIGWDTYEIFHRDLQAYCFALVDLMLYSWNNFTGHGLFLKDKNTITEDFHLMISIIPYSDWR